MPVTVRKIRNKFRVVDFDTNRIARNKGGTPVDGGGHRTMLKAAKQQRAINRSIARQGHKTKG